SLLVAGMALRYRAMAALARAGSMGIFGLWGLIASWQGAGGALAPGPPLRAGGLLGPPDHPAAVRARWAVSARAAHLRSAWIGKRNDVRGNVAVLLAALGVFGTGTAWPDVIVATSMVALALQGASIVLRQSIAELRIAA